jgi:hypothetical protein
MRTASTATRRSPAASVPTTVARADNVSPAKTGQGSSFGGADDPLQAVTAVGSGERASSLYGDGIAIAHRASEPEPILDRDAEHADEAAAQHAGGDAGDHDAGRDPPAGAGAAGVAIVKVDGGPKSPVAAL